MHAQRWSTSSSVNPQWLVNVPDAALTAINRYKATPVDLYGLLEAAMLHELTHTTAGGESDDIQSALQGVVGTGGWLYATTMANLN